jgi:hypothetical protein
MTVETVETFPTEQKFDDQALFDHAEEVEAPDTPDAPAAEVEQPEPEAQVSETPAERPVVDDNAPLVPSWRLREINEEKRTLADRLAALEAERATWQRPAPQPTEPPKQPGKAARPDPLLDPDGYADAIRNELREEALTERRNESMAKALETSPEEFQAAYKAATENGVIPELKARMNNSRDPGKELLAWHKEQKVRAEVGNDPNAWLEKKLAERLQDPAFLAKAVEMARGSAQPQQNGRPNVALPPSLNGASRSPLTATVDTDISDEGLWQHANA